MGNFLPDLRVEIAFDAGVRTPAASRTWTDVSDYVELGEGVTLAGGRSDERAVCEANTLALVLDNSDGRFTPERAASPHYPNVKLGRPIRVRANYLTNGNRGTFDTDATGWTGTSCTVARVTTPTHSGDGALSMTATAGATIFADATVTGTPGDEVAPGATYTAEAYLRRNGVTARDGHVRVEWYDAGGAIISTSTGASVALSTSYQLVAVTATAPATAAFGRTRVGVTLAGIGEVFHVDDVGLLSDRFLGFVDEWPVQWDDSTDATAVSSITASSRLSLLGEGTELRSVVAEEYALDDPVAHYSMGEPEGATQAADSSGNGGPPLQQRGSGTAVVFGTATGPGTDGLTAATFAAGTYFKANHPAPAGDWTVECFFSSTVSPGYVFGYGEIGVRISGGVFVLDGASGASVDVTTATASDGQTRHLAITRTAFDNIATLYVDGVIEGGIVGGADQGDLGALYVGNANLDSGGSVSSNTLEGVLAHVAIYDTALTMTRIQAHSDAGLNGFAGELAAARIARYAGYGDIPAAEVSSASGAVPLSHIDTTDKTLADAMRVVETTDGGVLFDGRDGRLNYQDRQTRYQAASSFTLDAATQQLDGAVRPLLDRSAILNDVTGKNLGGTVTARVVDAASIEDHGRKAADVEVATDDEEEPFQAASRQVNRYAEPRVRVATLAPVDILTLGDAMVALLLTADIGTRFTVTGQPSQASTSSAEYFVEGYVDTISHESWHRSFNVSAATLSDAWLLNSATRSQLDTTTVLG